MGDNRTVAVTEPSKRRVAIRKWTCAHHPDGPPTLPADGYEREELTLEQAYDEATLAGLQFCLDHFQRDVLAGGALRELGVCCIGHRWYTAGWRDPTPAELKMEPFNDLMVQAFARAAFPPPTILLDELARGPAPDDGSAVRVPLIAPPTEIRGGTVRDVGRVGDDATDGET